VNKRVAPLQGRDLAIIVIDTNNGMSHFRKANSGNQADISRPDNGNLYVLIHHLMKIPHISKSILFSAF
jgi:hypothetical protein